MLHQDNLNGGLVIGTHPASPEGAIKDPAAPCQGASKSWYCLLFAGIRAERQDIEGAFLDSIH